MSTCICDKHRIKFCPFCGREDVATDVGEQVTKKPLKNMKWVDGAHATEYRTIPLGIELEPTKDLYLRQLAAGYSADSMKVFLARALVHALVVLKQTGPWAVQTFIEKEAKEIDLDFDCEAESLSAHMEAVAAAKESESRTDTGVQE